MKHGFSFFLDVAFTSVIVLLLAASNGSSTSEVGRFQIMALGTQHNSSVYVIDTPGGEVKEVVSFGGAQVGTPFVDMENKPVRKK